MDSSRRRRARRGEAQSYMAEMIATGDRSLGCWEWPFARNRLGYGLIRVGVEGSGLAHRYAFKLATGTEPEVCRHTCDNPPCFNPAHLLDGTVADNARDSCERGQQPRGERIGKAKLTAEAVAEMRELVRAGATVMSVARQFEVTHRTAMSAVKGEGWAHVPTPPAPVVTFPTLAPCGTATGYARHRRHGEPACSACREANSAYARAQRAAKRELSR